MPDGAMKKKRRPLPRIKTKYARYRLRTGYSRIHRFAVYALEDIPAKRVVIEYTGKIRTWGQTSKVPPAKGIYLACLKRGLSVDGGTGGSGAQLVNHSCNPSLNFKRAQGRLFLVSRRKIRAGEELTVHYHYPAKLRRVPCRCGARNCRRTLRLVIHR
jgi:SET domain-containing protein